jgi:hypothetical protein
MQDTLKVANALRDFLALNLSWEVDISEQWASLCSRWRFLDEDVKPRVYERGLGWIREDASARLDTLLRGTYHPLYRAIWVRDYLLSKLISTLNKMLDVESDEFIVEHYSSEVEGDAEKLVRESLELQSELARISRLEEAIRMIRMEGGLVSSGS